jgi:hypothetical protein
VLPGQTFEALEGPPTNLYVHDRATGERALLSRSLASPSILGNWISEQATIDGPSRQVLFLSAASNLALHDFREDQDLYLADLTADGSALFSDGFELGHTLLWSQTVGGN